MIRPLHLRLRPTPLEPAHGALMRLAGRHGAIAVLRFASSLGLAWREVMAGRHVAAVAVRAGLDPDALAACSPVIDTSSRTAMLAGQTLMLGDWSVSGRRACPSCIAEDEATAAATGRPADWVVTHRLFLDVRSIRRCPIHRMPLADACPGCGTALRWSRAPLARCPAACALGSFAAHGDLDIGLDAYLAARLGLGDAAPVPVLDALPFRRAVQFCERVGRLDMLGWTPRLGRQTADDDDACRRSGFAMAADWPASLFPALDRIVAESAAADAGDGLIARYGWVHPDWLSVEEDEVSTLVRPLVRAHAVVNAIVARDEPILAHAAPPTVSLTAAAAASGMGVERTRRLLDEARVVPDGSRRGVAFAMAPSAVAATLRAAAMSTMTRCEAGRAFGLGRSRVADLLEAGLLDRSGGRVTVRSVEALRRLLLDACATSPVPDGAVPLVAACRGRGVPVADALARIVSARLRVWPDPGSAGTASLLVRPADLGPPRRAVSRVDAARRIRVHPQCMGELVGAGAIATAADGGVDAASLADFAGRHVAASELAASQGRSSRAIIAELAERDVVPAFGPPDFRQAVYVRASLPRRLTGG